jgi:iron(III) transport system ATP-binding protein
VLRLRNVSKSFGATRALDAASLYVGRGEIVALLGPTGCGKTTALRVLAGFERPDSGCVEIDGTKVAGEGAWTAPDRRRVGMVFQDYALFPHLDVAANVGFGLPRRARRGGRVKEVLDLVGLSDFADRYPDELSGGQQQRVALARALAPRPAVVLLDEPWGAIDPMLRPTLRDEVVAILREAGVTALIVTHDREDAFSVADRIALMRDGRIVQAGVPEQLYFAPTDRWCAEFAGAANMVHGQRTGGQVVTPLGRFPAMQDGPESEVDVLLRPELVGLEPDGAGQAEIVERTFLGHDVLYRVRLEDGTNLWSQRPSNEQVPLGARVNVSVYDGPVVVFPS